MTELASQYRLAALFFPAMLLSLVLVPVAIRISFRINAVDRPDGRKVHTKAISRLGGAAMVAGLVVPLLLFVGIDRPLIGFLAGVLIVSATGLLDDVLGIPPAAKFLGQIVAAGTFIAVTGAVLPGFGDFLGVGEVRFGALASLVTVFCMVGVMNAFNLSDGLDGLAAGICAIACVFLGIFAHAAGQPTSLSILIALFGAVLGFLRYNTRPANLFMGDTGSLLLGYSLSAVTVMLVREGGEGASLSPVTVAAVIALPIMDTLLVMGRRVLRRVNPFQPDRTHLHHRLMDLGLSHDAVVPILYFFSACFGVQAWVLIGRSDGTQFAAVLGLGGILYGALSLARRAGEFRSVGGIRLGMLPPPSRLDGAIAALLERSVTPVRWVIAVGLLFPMVLVDHVPVSAGMLALGTAGFITVLFPWRTRRSRSSICYGLVYAACVSIVGALQLSPGAPGWIHLYMLSLCGAVLLWVALKMRYRGRREVVRISSYEMLLIALSLSVPLVLIPAMGWGIASQTAALSVCLESVALLLAIKIFIRRGPAQYHAFATALLVGLLLVGAKGIVGTPISVSPLQGDANGVSLTEAPARPPPSSDLRAASAPSPPLGLAAVSSPNVLLSPFRDRTP